MCGGNAFGRSDWIGPWSPESYNLRIMREQLPNATIIVDAGVGTAATRRSPWNSALTPC